jgi:NACalpha-BTF3-like transcription factor
MYIDNPEVMTTGSTGSFIIFGEAKFLDFSSQGQNKFIDKMKEAEAAKKNQASNPTIQEEDNEEETEEAGDLPEDTIKQLMEYAKCSRGKAIKCLKKTNGDVVEAITLAN